MTVPATRTAVLRIPVPLRRADLPGVYARTCLLLARRASVLVVSVDGVAADAVALEALARLRLVTRRAGCAVRFEGASAELRELIAFAGLSEAVASG